MNLLSRLASRSPGERAGLVELFPTWANQTTEKTPQAFLSMSEQVFKQSPVVFGAIQARSMVFSDVAFAFRRISTGEMVRDHPNLALLKNPWPGGTTADMLKRMEQDASLSGSAFMFKGVDASHIQRLRPDLVDVYSNGREVIGYFYYPDGRNGRAVYIQPREMAHYTPIPDPSQNFVGLSWVQSALLDIMTDQKMGKHQAKFYENAATPNMFVKVESQLTDQSRQTLRSELDRRFGGWENAYKTIVLDGGADLRAVGADFQQSDFAANREANEARIVLASGVPPIVLGIQAGLDSATYSNYDQAFKQFAILLRSLWKEATTALESIVTVPRGLELVADDTDVQAFQDSAKNVAELQQLNAATINSLITGGFTPESANEAVTKGDFSKLQHTGLFSVQLQPPGTQDPIPMQESPDETGQSDED